MYSAQVQITCYSAASLGGLLINSRNERVMQVPDAVLCKVEVRESAEALVSMLAVS